MKRLITITLTIALTLTFTLTLAACGGNDTPAINDTPQVQETEAPAPTEAPTPEPTPDPTPEATPDPDIIPIETLAPMNVGGESFFPNIDDSYLPDDIVKYTVGTLTASGDAMPEEAGFRPFFLRFEDVTEDDYKELIDHYKSGDVLSSNDIDTSEPGAEKNTFHYEWGKIRYVYYYNEGKIEVTISITQE